MRVTSANCILKRFNAKLVFSDFLGKRFRLNTWKIVHFTDFTAVQGKNLFIPDEPKPIAFAMEREVENKVVIKMFEMELIFPW